MKNPLALAALVGLAALSHAQSLPSLQGAVTRAYTKKNGTSVESYRRSLRDKSRKDNYSTKGSINPYTGKRGVVDPLKPKRSRKKKLGFS